MTNILKNFEGKDGIIEANSKERSVCEFLSFELVNDSIKLSFANAFPVRELNSDPDNQEWKIELGPTVFGSKYSFEVDGKIQSKNSNAIEFIEKERGLVIKLNFDKEKVKQTMLKYIDALVPKEK